MPQSLLVGQDGTLSLQIPQPESTEAEFLDHKWATSHIDEICVEDLLELSFLEASNPYPEPPARKVWRDDPRPLEQYLLSNQDGIMMLQKSSIRYVSESKSGQSTHAATIPGSKSPTTIFSLPVELRLQIYRYLLVSKKTPFICPQSTSHLRIITHLAKPCSYGIFSEILATCHQINREGTPVLYGENLFSREYYWRRILNYEMQYYLVPISRSCRIRARNLEFLYRVSMFRQYHQWFLGNGDLKAFRDFPLLRELHIEIDLNDSSHGLDLNIFWQEAMKSIDRKRPTLNRLNCLLHLAFDKDYRAWDRRCLKRKGELDFTLHLKKKAQLEKWIEGEGLFSDQHFIWSFKTIVPVYTRYYCSITFVIEQRRDPEKCSKIQCQIVHEVQSQQIMGQRS